jgi:hypothetical protein
LYSLVRANACSGRVESVGCRIVLCVAAGRLRGEPLLHVPFVGAGALGQLPAGYRIAVGHRLVQAELVADEDGRCVHHGSEVPDEPSDELVELVFVNRWLDGHCKPSSWSLASQRTYRGSLADLVIPGAITPLVGAGSGP